MSMDKCGAGWKRQGGKGPFISLTIELGALGTIKGILVTNDKKTNASQPDYNFLVGDGAPQESKATATKPPTNYAPKATQRPPTKPAFVDHTQGPPADLWEQSSGDEIPF